jgi:integrase
MAASARPFLPTHSSPPRPSRLPGAAKTDPPWPLAGPGVPAGTLGGHRERPRYPVAPARALLRRVLTPGVWTRVVKLPLAMMAAARRQQHAPVRCAVTAQLAVAIAILAVAPVRLANLAAIRLGVNLIKPGGPDSNYWLVFPDYDVKNRVPLEYPLKPYLTRLIDEYAHDFRPTLSRRRNEDWLFPGQRGGAKGKVSFSGQITDRIHKATGLRMTVHQFRHAAGTLILQRRPGEYELVRRLLGHRNVQTTINAYVGLENIQASEIFSKIVMEHLGDELEAAE